MRDNDRISLVGLVLESSLGIQRALGPVDGATIGVGGQAFGICLRLLRSEGHAMRMSDLATQTGVSPSGLTRAVDRLAAVGLVRRDSCATDHRVSYAVLTDEGVCRMSSAVAAHLEQLDVLLGGLFSPCEEATLAELLERLRDRVNPDASYVTSEDSAPDVSLGVLAG